MIYQFNMMLSYDAPQKHQWAVFETEEKKKKEGIFSALKAITN